MRNCIRIPISKMIKMLKEISAGGRICLYKNINSNTSKVASLFNHEITMFNTHFIITNNLLLKNSQESSKNYKILFKKYLKSIFSMFFIIKIKNKPKNKKNIRYVVKNRPNLNLYIEFRKIIDEFHEKEENEFNINEIKKNMFILNSLMHSDDGNESTTNGEFDD